MERRGGTMEIEKDGGKAGPGGPRREFALFAAAALALAGALHFHTSLLRSAEELFHFRHAALYLERGPFFRDFPWLSPTPPAPPAADLWYGFHLLLAPFARLEDPLLALKLAGTLVTAALALLFYLAARRSGLAWPWLWAGFLFVGTNGLARWGALRPEVLALGLLALLLPLLAAGRPWQALLAAGALAFVHLPLAAAALLAAATVTAVRRFTEGSWQWRPPLAALGGVLLGWLLRPGALEALPLLRAALLVPLLERQPARPADTLPAGFPPGAAADQVFLLLWVVGLLAACFLLRRARAAPAERTLLWSAAALSAVGLLLFLSVDGRARDLWSVFGVLALGAVVTRLAAALARSRRPFPERARRTLVFLGGALLAVLTVHAMAEQSRDLLRAGIPHDRRRAEAEWLRAHTRPADAVFQLEWETFPELFFWSPESRYANGGAPRFLYAAAPGRYWQAHHLALGGATETTSAAPPGEPGEPEDTFTVLRRDFQAGAVLVVKARHPAFFAYLLEDPRYRQVADFDDTAIFLLVEEPAAAGERADG